MKNLMLLTFAVVMAFGFAQSASAFCGGEQTAILFVYQGSVKTVYVPHDLKVRRTASVDILGETGVLSVVEDEDRNTLVSLTLGKSELQGRARSYFRCNGSPMYIRWDDKDLPEEDYKKITKVVYEISDAAKKKTLL